MGDQRGERRCRVERPLQDERGAHGSTVTCWTLYQDNVFTWKGCAPRVAVLELF
jgi:hypothetical protein